MMRGYMMRELMNIVRDTSQPINWAYASVPKDPRPRMIAFLICFGIIVAFYVWAMIVSHYYLLRRRLGKQRYYKVDLSYKDEREDETLYLITYGTIDIYMFYYGDAKVKVKRIKKPEEIDTEWYLLDKLIKAQQQLVEEAVERAIQKEQINV